MCQADRCRDFRCFSQWSRPWPLEEAAEAGAQLVGVGVSVTPSSFPKTSAGVRSPS